MTKNICIDAMIETNDPKENEKNKSLAVLRVIENPKLLDTLDIEAYCEDLSKKSQGNIKILINQIS